MCLTLWEHCIVPQVRDITITTKVGGDETESPFKNGDIVTVILGTATDGAKIYYTTNGDTPTASSTLYEDPFIVTADSDDAEIKTIKVLATKDGYTARTGEFTIMFMAKDITVTVTGISISNNPGKISYNEGENLDLTGLKAKLSFSDGSDEIVDLEDFEAKGITTDPENGVALTVDEHDGKNIKVKYNDLYGEGDPLTVTAVTFAGGTGTIEDPYKVATAKQLNNVRDYNDKHFIQIADIDLVDYLNEGGAGYNEGAGWEPIIDFEGNYDGNNKKIVGLKIGRADENDVGLFQEVKEDGSIKDLALENVDIKGKDRVGGLVGRNRGIIENCSTSGSSSSVYGIYYVGGLVGENYGNGIIVQCYSTCNVEGSYYVGGLVGDNYSSDDDKTPKVEKSFATGYIKGTTESTGGLVGRNYNGEIENSYAAGNVEGAKNVGGLAGENEDSGTAKISNSYSTGKVTGSNAVGGLVGRNDKGLIQKSYWDTETSNQASSAGGVGKTTLEMSNKDTFDGWDFSDVTGIWTIGSSPTSYPYFQWQNGANIPYPAFAGGNGSEASPYQVATAEQLNNVRNHLDKHFIQIADIDLEEFTSVNGAGYNDGMGWEPIGDGYSFFTGSYDGNDKKIYNLKINRLSDSDPFIGLGIFGYNKGKISNTSLVDVSVRGNACVGGLVGYNSGGQIINSSVIGDVTGDSTGIGGLVGVNYNGGENNSLFFGGNGYYHCFTICRRISRSKYGKRKCN